MHPPLMASHSRPVDSARQCPPVPPRDRPLFEKLGDDGVEGNSVVTEQDARPLLGLREEAADFLVNDLLVPSAWGRSEKGEAACWEIPSDPYPMGPSRGKRPHSGTISMARLVALERSPAAPVDASPMTRFVVQ
jgi:hypothetical protein